MVFEYINKNVFILFCKQNMCEHLLLGLYEIETWTIIFFLRFWTPAPETPNLSRWNRESQWSCSHTSQWHCSRVGAQTALLSTGQNGGKILYPQMPVRPDLSMLFWLLDNVAKTLQFSNCGTIKHILFQGFSSVLTFWAQFTSYKMAWGPFKY